MLFVENGCMKIIAIMIIIVLAFPLVVLTSEMPVPVTPKEIIETIKTEGLAYVSTQIFNSEVWRKHVYPGISSGDPDWLEVAKILKPSLDADYSEELSDALARALLNRPYAVIPILKELWWQKLDACYFGWDSEVPAKSVRDYVNKLEKALLKDSNKENEELRRLCFKGIKKTKEELCRNKM